MLYSRMEKKGKMGGSLVVNSAWFQEFEILATLSFLCSQDDRTFGLNILARHYLYAGFL